MELDNEKVKRIEEALRGWDTGHKERVRECQNYLAGGMFAAGACAMGTVWTLASWAQLDQGRHPLFMYKVPSWVWLVGFAVVGSLLYLTARSLFIRLEGLTRAAHQDGLRLFMEKAKSAGVRVTRKDVLQLLSVPDFYVW